MLGRTVIVGLVLYVLHGCITSAYHSPLPQCVVDNSGHFFACDIKEGHGNCTDKKIYPSGLKCNLTDKCCKNEFGKAKCCPVQWCYHEEGMMEPENCELSHGKCFVPLIYDCDKALERCCMNQGKPSCCATETSSNAIVKQVILWSCISGAVLAVGLVAFLYFKDLYCFDAKPGSSKKFLGIFPQRQQFKKKINMQETLYPDEAEAGKVADPIFGQPGSEVPTYASINDVNVKM